MKPCSAGTRGMRMVGWGRKSQHNPTNLLVLHTIIILTLNPSSSTTMLRWEGEIKGAENTSRKEQGLKSDQSSHIKRVPITISLHNCILQSLGMAKKKPQTIKLSFEMSF